MSDVASLFGKDPSNWGLRGDPYLWRELQAALAGVPLPDSEPALARMLADAFECAVGEPLATAGNVFVERFAHGGMSSGHVSGEHWRNVLVPVLIERSRTA